MILKIIHIYNNENKKDMASWENDKRYFEITQAIEDKGIDNELKN